MFTRLVVVLLFVFSTTGSVHADAVALLPLDAETKLEIYGQPVASEIARALVAGKLDVVVVGPKMAVPERAALVVDGKIATEKDGSIVLSVRVRDRKSGEVIRQLRATAPTLANIDRAAAELSAQVMPVVRDKLAELAKPSQPPDVARPAEPRRPVAPATRPLLVGIGVGKHASRVVEPLRLALVDRAPGWVASHRRAATAIDAVSLDAKSAPQTVAASNADRAIAFEVLGYERRAGKVPVAKARVRVRIADAAQVVFDRVVVTDTVVGDRDMSDDELARRVAEEVLAILRPHVRKAIPQWP